MTTTTTTTKATKPKPARENGSTIAGPHVARLLRVVCKDTVFSRRLYFGLTVQGSVISERAEP